MLKEKLLEDLKMAMKEKNKVHKGVITLIRSGLVNEEKSLKVEKLTPEQEIAVVSRELKQTRQSLEEYEKAGREDLVRAEKQKIVYIQEYLPKQMTVDEINELLVSMNISKDTNMGQAIGQVMAQVKGKAEGKMVSKAVKDYLSS